VEEIVIIELVCKLCQAPCHNFCKFFWKFVDIILSFLLFFISSEEIKKKSLLTVDSKNSKKELNNIFLKDSCKISKSISQA
jgi:hypothetical protein